MAGTKEKKEKEKDAGSSSTGMGKGEETDLEADGGWEETLYLEAEGHRVCQGSCFSGG